jgi:hypothetical protein
MPQSFNFVVMMSRSGKSGVVEVHFEPPPGVFFSVPPYQARFEQDTNFLLGMFVATFPNIRIPQDGLYTVSVVWEGKTVATLPFPISIDPRPHL